MHDSQPFIPFQRGGGDAQTLEVIQDIQFNALHPGLGGLEGVRFDAEGQVLGFDQAVVALCQLIPQEGLILYADIIKLVPPPGDIDAV